MRFDTWLDTGVTVTVPAGTDPDTDAGYGVVKAAARAALLAPLASDGFDLIVEPAPHLG